MNNLWKKLFGNFSIMKKMLLISLVTFTALSILSTIFLFEEQRVMLKEKKNKLVNIIELSHSIIQSEYNNFSSGKITETEAKNRALEVIYNLKFNNDNYIWVNNTTMPYPE